ncbi:hypothetical protein B0H11DRAFT_617 [Mycena galericulata]|nr:hypothetical protein B0H11DRAFT_617 [Mycena galericulata]
MATEHVICHSDEIFSDLETIGGGLIKDDIYVEPLDDTFDLFSLDEVWDEFDPSPTASTPLKRAFLWSDDEGDGSSSSGGERDPKRPKTRSLSPISLATSLLETYETYPQIPRNNYNFRAFHHHPESVYVDKTRSILQLPETFRLLLLRPPRFGKTAFLSTLEQYYDIRAADRFNTDFGPLSVVSDSPDAPPQHTQHLILSFDLSEIDRADIVEISTALTSRVFYTLRGFLMVYARELQLSDPETFLRRVNDDVPSKPSDLFEKVFGLVRSRSYSLFVGVDDYDAPIRLHSFMHFECPETYAGFAQAQTIESLLDSSFWAPLHAGMDVIAKLFVTGTLSLSSPAALQNRRRSTSPAHFLMSRLPSSNCDGFAENTPFQVLALPLRPCSTLSN